MFHLDSSGGNLIFVITDYQLETVCMEKDLTPGNSEHSYFPLPDMVVVKDDTSKPGKIFYSQLQSKLSGIINIESITTPFLNPPLNINYNRNCKRMLDILFAAIVIIAVLSWLIPIIAFLIIIDSRGPVFFLQKRNKRYGEVFTCIKFRSMILNPAADILPASEDDKRITRIGRFLRNHYLDELPQFFNVLWGDMSVAGPRPHMIHDNLKYEMQIEQYAYRHKVKPGITGLAQVLGYTGAASDIQKMQDRINMDVFYVRHWSFKLDMIIFYRTIKKIFGL